MVSPFDAIPPQNDAELHALLKSSHESDRLLALSVIRENASDRYLPLLAACLKDCSLEAVSPLAEILADIGGAAAVDLLRQALRRFDHPNNPSEIRSLQVVKAAINRLQSLMVSFRLLLQGDIDEADSAMRHLALVPEEGIGIAISLLLYHNDLARRVIAARHLGAYSFPTVAKQLVDALEYSNNWANHPRDTHQARLIEEILSSLNRITGYSCSADVGKWRQVLNSWNPAT